MDRKEEETFKFKEKHVEKEKLDESKVNSIMEKLELITQQINLISNYLMGISPSGEQWKLQRIHNYKNKNQ
jgi:hypothetical protein